MEIRKIQNTPTSFTAIKLGYDLSGELAMAIKESPMFQQFGKKYNGYVDTALIQSSSGKAPHPALMIRDIEPANIWVQLINRIRGIHEGHKTFMYVQTRGYTEQDLLNKIQNSSGDYLIKRFETRLK